METFFKPLFAINPVSFLHQYHLANGGLRRSDLQEKCYSLSTYLLANEIPYATHHPETLGWLKQTIQENFGKEDPNAKKIETYLKSLNFCSTAPIKNPGEVLREIVFPAEIKKALAYEAPQAREDLFFGFNISLDEMKKVIQEKGEKFKEVIIFEVDDELLSIMAEKCVNLEILQLIDAYDWPWTGFTNKGLANIGKFEKLTKLDIDAHVGAFYITAEGIHSLLSNDNMRNHLTELTLPTMGVTSSVISALRVFKKLEKLKIQTYGLTPAIASLFESSYLRNTLQEIIFKDISEVNDAMINGLAKCTALKKCHLSPDIWKVKNETLHKFLELQTSLESLTLGSKVQIDGVTAMKLPLIKSLKTLELENCSQIDQSGFDALFQPNETLEILSLKKINAGFPSYSPAFTDNQFALLASLENLKQLTLEFSQSSYITNAGLNAFTSNEVLQKNLKALYLQGLTRSLVREQGYEVLGRFTQLEVLSLKDCKWFNDRSLELLSLSPLRESLQQLEIHDVALSDVAVYYLAKFRKLSRLFLSDCSSFTEEGRLAFVQTSSFRKNFTALALNKFMLPLEQMQKLMRFPALKLLINENNSDCSYEDNQILFKQKPATLVFITGTGESTGHEHFTTYVALLKQIIDQAKAKTGGFFRFW